MRTAMVVLRRALPPFALLAAACADGTDERADAPPASDTSAAPTSTGPATHPDRLAVSVVEGPKDGSVGMALHPDASPARVRAGGVPSEVCPVGLDGRPGPGASWPADSFERCMAVDASGRELPATDGSWHVAFSVRPTSPAPVREVVVDYARADAFFEVLPPAGAPVELEATFTPGTSTVAAQAFLLPSYQPVAGATLDVTQGGRRLSTEAPCDFPSEIPCFGGGQPGAETNVRFRHAGGGGGQVAVFLSWG